ncbi:MAG: asparagine synthetase B [Dehalococcoidia bacterium]|nr:asparagine synthetase B [Dehalococcoidia bacterium]
MCGILGAFGPTIHHKKLRERLDSMRHRGDQLSAEIYQDDGVFLGCHRLGIMDPEHGMQPASTENGDIKAVFNGEIYNFEQLRIQLEAHDFSNGGDTETVAHAFEEFGTAAFQKLDGMFAVCLWDKADKSFYAARDQMGVKPLYYVNEKEEGNFYFASERKALLGLNCIIQTVPPGHLISRNGIEKYCEMNIAPTVYSPGVLRGLVGKAVVKRMRADRPIGVFLSGGLDSSIIAYHASANRRGIPAYTIGTEGADDLVHSEMMARTFGMKHHIRIVKRKDILDALPKVIWHTETFNPFLVRVGVANYLVAEEASKDVRVVLSGEGADELFAGYEYLQRYDRYLWPWLLKQGVNNLHRTELQRLDRTTMAWAVEAREPFMDIALVKYAMGLHIDCKLIRYSDKWIEKWCLKDAYRPLLPAQIIDRTKNPFDKGSGISGILTEHAEKEMSDLVYQKEVEKHQFLQGADKETVFYFQIWKETFLAKNEQYPGDSGRYIDHEEIMPSEIIRY